MFFYVDSRDSGMPVDMKPLPREPIDEEKRKKQKTPKGQKQSN